MARPIRKAFHTFFKRSFFVSEIRRLFMTLPDPCTCCCGVRDMRSPPRLKYFIAVRRHPGLDFLLGENETKVKEYQMVFEMSASKQPSESPQEKSLTTTHNSVYSEITD